jgi:hypothetical protein
MLPPRGDFGQSLLQSSSDSLVQILRANGITRLLLQQSEFVGGTCQSDQKCRLCWLSFDQLLERRDRVAVGVLCFLLVALKTLGVPHSQVG